MSNPLRDHIRKLASELDVVEILENLPPGRYTLDVVDRTGHWTSNAPPRPADPNSIVSIFLGQDKVLHMSMESPAVPAANPPFGDVRAYANPEPFDGLN